MQNWHKYFIKNHKVIGGQISAPSRIKVSHGYTNKNDAVARVVIAGTTYIEMYDGSLHRVDPPRPYRGKRGRKEYIKQRREDKDGAAQDNQLHL